MAMVATGSTPQSATRVREVPGQFRMRAPRPVSMSTKIALLRVDRMDPQAVTQV